VAAGLVTLRDDRVDPCVREEARLVEFVAEPKRRIPASLNARTRSGDGTPKWKLTTRGRSSSRAASISSSSMKLL
jgi:hypothetical protein